MSSKQCMSIIAGLILLNIATVLYFTVGMSSKNHTAEIVASVGDKEISRTGWMDELEKRHGKDILTAMINEEVILQLAHKNQLVVSDVEMKVEPVIRQVLYGTSSGPPAYISKEVLKKKIKVSILLEKLLTKDVMITDEEVESYYKNNESLLKLTDLYHLSQIITADENEAKTINESLKSGTDFSDIAMENIDDKYTTDLGRDLGYISLDSKVIPVEYKEKVDSLRVGEWSQPIKIKEGYAILYLHDRIGKLSYGEMKSTLKRKIAMEQINASISAEMLWGQLGVDWIYGK